MSSSNVPAKSTPRQPARSGGQGPPTPGSGGVSIDPMRIALTYWPLVIAAGVVSLVVGVGLYIVLGKVAPKYTSETIFEVRGAATANTAEGTGNTVGADELERYMRTQVRIMESDRILSSALDTNEVRATKWLQEYKEGGAYNMKEALIAVRSMVSARTAPDSAIIQLSVTAPDRNDAAVIATAIQKRLIRDNAEQNTGEVRVRLQDINARITDAQAALESVEQSIAARTRSENLESQQQQNSAAATEIKQLQPTIVGIRTQLSSARETLDQRERMLGGPDVMFNPSSTPVGFVYPESIRAQAENSRIVANFDLQISQLESQIQSTSVRLGENHRVVRQLRDTLRAQIDQRNSELESAMANFFAAELEALRTSIPRLERTERDLSEDLEEAKLRQNETAITIQEIENLKLQQQRYRETLKNLDAGRTDLNLIITRAGRVRVLSPASTPDSRSFPQPVPIVGASVVLITGAVIGLILLKELREQRIRTPQDVAAIPRTRVVGVLPEASMDPSRPKRIEHACLDTPDGAIAESVRQIRSTLIQRMDERGHKTLLVGSGMPGSGSTAVASNLAQSIASTGRSVLIIDANMRRPAMHTAYDIPEGPGLADVLKGEHTLASATTSNLHGVAELSLLPAGFNRKQAYERFLSESMERLLEEAREIYDIVIIDVAPGIVSSDMNALASYVDACVLVVRAYAEKRGLVARLRNQLAVTGSEFLGVVVNAVKPAAGGYMKRNFEQTLSYQQPKRVKNTAEPKSKTKKKKLRGSETTPTPAGSLPEPTDED